MDPDETTLTQISKRSRIANGKVKRRGRRAGAGEEEEEDDEEEEEEEEEEGEKVARAWQQASRIYRVSRASGGKDRHSKVITAKGLRDRRVRLSVSTAIQFYDLQDRLGYDQPSKAVEWLIKAAQDAIAELPSLNGTFPNRTRPTTTLHQQHSSTQNDSFYESSRDEALVVVGRGGSEARAEADPEPDPSTHRYLTKSTCSSTSETSKGSVLSLTRSESRVKARERARERAKEKEKVVVSTTTSVSMDQHALNTNSHSGGSFTELLMDVNLTQQTPGYSHKGGGGKREETAGGSLAFTSHAMDYLNAGVYGPGLFQASKTHNHNSNQPHFSSPLMSIASLNHPSFMGGVDHHPELQQFSFSQDHLIPVTNDYNLNFSMTSLGAGYNRGTLQSNSSPLPHIQKFSSPADGGAIMPFFLPTAHANTAENQFSGGLDGRLQLCYSDGCRHSDLKGKGKN